MAHTVAMIRLGTSADLPAAAGVYRRASLSNEGDRDNLLAHPEHLILGPEGLAEGRMYVAEEDGSVVGFATWALVGGVTELEDLFVDPGWRRRGVRRLRHDRDHLRRGAPQEARDQLTVSGRPGQVPAMSRAASVPIETARPALARHGRTAP